MKKTLGSVIKETRRSLGLSQQALAEKVGVKGSYIAYIENGDRRPSLALLAKLADVLGLEKDRLFILSHPEARDFLVASRPPASKPNTAWHTFLSNRAMLRRHNVTPTELRILKQVNLLGVVISPRMFLFILNSMRQALEEE
jgi:transcriptional regulator with XRE-family HTH domain